jgi:hypothetical protein
MEEQIFQIIAANNSFDDIDEWETAKEITTFMKTFISWRDTNVHDHRVFNEKTQKFITLYTYDDVYEYWIKYIYNK